MERSFVISYSTKNYLKAINLLLAYRNPWYNAGRGYKLIEVRPFPIAGKMVLVYEVQTRAKNLYEEFHKKGIIKTEGSFSEELEKVRKSLRDLVRGLFEPGRASDNDTPNRTE